MPEQNSLTKALRALLPLIPPAEKRRFWFLLALAVIMALNELLITGLVALLAAVFGSIDAVLQYPPVIWLRAEWGIDLGREPRYLALYILCAILAAIIAKNALNLFQQWHISSFSEKASNTVKEHLLRFFLRAPFLWVLRAGTSDMLFGMGAAGMLGTILLTTMQIFTSLLMIITIFGGLVAASPLPSLMFLAVLALGGALIMKATRRLLDARSGAAYKADYQAHNIQQLAVHGLKEMRLYGRENAIFSAYTEKLGQALHAKKRQQLLARLPVYALEILGFCTLVGVLAFLIFVQDASIARISGIMGFMAAAAWRSLPVANRMVESLTSLRTLLPYLNKIAELTALEKNMARELLPPFAQDFAPLAFEHSVSLNDATFRYPGAQAPALQNVSFSIKAGEMVGLVGLSGAGKSTLVNILTGLIPPESGRLLVDDAEVTKENARSWLNRIGYVAQAPYILDASLAENIALSRWGESIDRERVRQCCKMAALDFVDDLEHGIDAMLGERGTRLSGGQAQRVAIARALYSEPDLIIFDEATSSLDLRNEKAILDTILSLRSKVTMVIIAHRLSTVEGCDSIIWLEKGRVYRAGAVREVLPEYQVTLRVKQRGNKASSEQEISL